jgi:hypothetical protein
MASAPSRELAVFTVASRIIVAVAAKPQDGEKHNAAARTVLAICMAIPRVLPFDFTKLSKR